MRRDTLIDFFRDLIAIRGEFLVYDDGYRRRSHTYEQVGRAARGFAARLQAAGLSKGAKVVFWGENRPEWIVCYWACLISGIVVVPIDYRSSPDFVARVRRLVEAPIVLVGDDVPGAPEEGFDRPGLGRLEGPRRHRHGPDALDLEGADLVADAVVADHVAAVAARVGLGDMWRGQTV